MEVKLQTFEQTHVVTGKKTCYAKFSKGGKTLIINIGEKTKKELEALFKEKTETNEKNETIDKMDNNSKKR